MGADTGRRLTHEEWTAEGRRRFGERMRDWRFCCPVCGHTASGEDYQAAGAPMAAIGFSCIGRWREGSRDAFTGKGPGPCNYAGGGLFGLNPVVVIDEHGKEHRMFEFDAAVARMTLVRPERVPFAWIPRAEVQPLLDEAARCDDREVEYGVMAPDGTVTLQGAA